MPVDTNPFMIDLGLRQGRIKPSLCRSVDGGWVWLLGIESPYLVYEDIAYNDEIRLYQYVDLTNVDLIRARLRLKQPRVMPTKRDVSKDFSVVGGASSVVFTATNTAPIVVKTTGNHGLSTGCVVQVSGVVGNPAANGTWVVTRIDNDDISLDGSTGSGAYVSGGIVAVDNLGVATTGTGEKFIVPTTLSSIDFGCLIDVAGCTHVNNNGTHEIADIITYMSCAVRRANPSLATPLVSEGPKNGTITANIRGARWKLGMGLDLGAGVTERVRTVQPWRETDFWRSDLALHVSKLAGLTKVIVWLRLIEDKPGDIYPLPPD